MELRTNFNDFIESYKKLSTQKKRDVFIEDIREIIMLYLELANRYNIPVTILNNEEIIDIKKGNYSEDDYLEALYVYYNVLKEIVSGILVNTLK